MLIHLNRQRATGALTVTAQGITRKVFLNRGNAVFASSTYEDDRLGEVPRERSGKPAAPGKVTEEGTSFRVTIKDYIAKHNRGIIEAMLARIERIISEGDYRKTSAPQSFLARRHW